MRPAAAAAGAGRVEDVGHVEELTSVFFAWNRGDKAFCSAECRSRQMASEEQGRSKYPLDAPAALDCSPSPCSAPLLFPAGVAAA